VADKKKQDESWGSDAIGRGTVREMGLQAFRGQLDLGLNKSVGREVRR